MKKWLLVLGIATCLFSLTACDSKKEETAPFLTEEEAGAFGEQLVESLNLIIAQNATGQYEEGSWEARAVEGWVRGLEEIGSYKGIAGHSVVIGETNGVIKVNVKGAKHDGVVEIKVDIKEGITDVTTTVIYEFGELVGKATLSVILGLGITFAILILMFILISCFKLIPESLRRNSDKEEDMNMAVDNAIAQIIEKEELEDNRELVAVIAAAIAASQGVSSTDGFRVRSIKRANKSKWKQA